MHAPEKFQMLIFTLGHVRQFGKLFRRLVRDWIEIENASERRVRVDRFAAETCCCCQRRRPSYRNNAARYQEHVTSLTFSWLTGTLSPTPYVTQCHSVAPLCTIRYMR